MFYKILLATVLALMLAGGSLAAEDAATFAPIEFQEASAKAKAYRELWPFMLFGRINLASPKSEPKGQCLGDEQFLAEVANTFLSTDPQAPRTIFKVVCLSPEEAAERGIFSETPVYALVKSLDGIPVEYWTVDGRGLVLLAEYGWNEKRYFSSFQRSSFYQIDTDDKARSTRMSRMFYETDSAGLETGNAGSVILPFKPPAFDWGKEVQSECSAAGIPQFVKEAYGVSVNGGIGPFYVGTKAGKRSASRILKLMGVLPEYLSDDEAVLTGPMESLKAIAGLPHAQEWIYIKTNTWDQIHCTNSSKPATCHGRITEYLTGGCLNWGTPDIFCAILRWHWSNEDGIQDARTVRQFVPDLRPVIPQPPC